MRDWRGLIALVLAIGVSVALVAGILTAELAGGPITSEEVGLISTLSGAVIGAIASYLGSQHYRHEGEPMQEQYETPEREGDEPVEPEPAPDETVEPEPTVDPDPDAPPESADEEMDAMSGDENGE